MEDFLFIEKFADPFIVICSFMWFRTLCILEANDTWTFAFSSLSFIYKSRLHHGHQARERKIIISYLKPHYVTKGKLCKLAATPRSIHDTFLIHLCRIGALKSLGFFTGSPSSLTELFSYRRKHARISAKVHFIHSLCSEQESRSV